MTRINQLILSPLGVEFLESLLSAFRKLANHGLRLPPGNTGVLHKPLPDKPRDIVVVPSLLIEDEMVARDPYGPHRRATEQEPVTTNLLEATGRVLGKEGRTLVRHGPSRGSSRDSDAIKELGSEQPQLLRALTPPEPMHNVLFGPSVAHRTLQRDGRGYASSPDVDRHHLVPKLP
jgi:hypothetical protein